MQHIANNLAKDSVLHRMGRTRHEGHEKETWTFDGVPIAEIWPPETEIVTDGSIVKFVCSVKYRILNLARR